eukprot:scaffold39224_cov48-Prasinocladus_malaysianus.AAC.3
MAAQVWLKGAARRGISYGECASPGCCCSAPASSAAAFNTRQAKPRSTLPLEWDSARGGRNTHQEADDALLKPNQHSLQAHHFKARGGDRQRHIRAGDISNAFRLSGLPQRPAWPPPSRSTGGGAQRPAGSPAGPQTVAYGQPDGIAGRIKPTVPSKVQNSMSAKVRVSGHLGVAVAEVEAEFVAEVSGDATGKLEEQNLQLLTG